MYPQPCDHCDQSPAVSQHYSLHSGWGRMYYQSPHKWRLSGTKQAFGCHGWKWAHVDLLQSKGWKDLTKSSKCHTDADRRTDDSGHSSPWWTSGRRCWSGSSVEHLVFFLSRHLTVSVKLTHNLTRRWNDLENLTRWPVRRPDSIMKTTIWPGLKTVQVEERILLHLSSGVATSATLMVASSSSPMTVTDNRWTVGGLKILVFTPVPNRHSDCSCSSRCRKSPDTLRKSNYDLHALFNVIISPNHCSI